LIFSLFLASSLLTSCLFLAYELNEVDSSYNGSDIIETPDELDGIDEPDETDEADRSGESLVISSSEAKELMEGEGNYILLDVRTEEEFLEGHIQGAILIPYDEMANRAEAELTDKDVAILIYCRSGRRSAIAADILASMGYTRVYDFGGILDWSYEVVR